MSGTGSSISNSVIRRDFTLFVSKAFYEVHGERLQSGSYVQAVCYAISKFIKGEDKRLLINLPPQHLKSFIGTVCLTAYLLGANPRLRIILVANNDTLAEKLCGKIRDIMQSNWYRRVFETRIKDGHSRLDDFATREGGGVYAVSATGAITGHPADVVIYDDPHEINDWSNERALAAVWNNLNTLLSRLGNKVKGRMIVIAHRVSTDDISAQLLREEG